MKISTDKLAHLVVGALFAGAVAGLAAVCGLQADWWPALALLAAGAAGVGREAWQAITGRGTVDHADALATATGGAIVALGLGWAAPLAWLYAGLLACTTGGWWWTARRASQAGSRRVEIQEGGPRPRPPR